MGSTKNVLSSYQLVTAGTLSASGTSATVNVPYLDNVGIQINVTAPALTSGTFSVNVSVDNVTFIPLTLSGTPTVAGANDNILISINQLPYRYLNLVYTSGTSGAGSYNAFVTAKEIG